MAADKPTADRQFEILVRSSTEDPHPWAANSVNNVSAAFVRLARNLLRIMVSMCFLSGETG